MTKNEDYIKEGEDPMFGRIVDRIERIIVNTDEYKENLFPITLNHIEEYFDIRDLDKEVSQSILFKDIKNHTIDITYYRSDYRFETLGKNTIMYACSPIAIQIVKFLVLEELRLRGYLKFPYFSEINHIESFWKLEYKENEYVILNNESKVCFKLQYLPNQSIFNFPVIEVSSSNKPKEKDTDILKNAAVTSMESGNYIVLDSLGVVNNNKKEERKGMFNHKFGKVRGSVLALSYDGKIAVKKSNTEDYVRYNAETSTIENIKDLVINDNKWFFIIPATEVEIGDIIKFNDSFYQVIKVNKDNISAINLMNSTMSTIVKETIFGMSCYTKVISLIDKDTFGSDNNMIMFMMMEDDNMDMKELMMMQMFTNKDEKQNINPMMLALMMDDDDDDDMLTNMMMFQMMTGGNAQFGMDNMMKNPMMLMMLMKDKTYDSRNNKLFKMMMLMQMMNQNKKSEE